MRKQMHREHMRSQESFGSNMAAGVKGFILDPVNLIPGAGILKGASLLSKVEKGRSTTR